MAKNKAIKKGKKIDSQSHQLKWVLIVVAIAFIAFLGTYFYFTTPSTFEYAGLKWEKIDYSGLKMYHSIFPIFGNDFNMYLRNDPRENNIPVNASFLIYPHVIIALEPDAGNCYGASLGQLTLGQFLGAAKPAVKKIDVAITDKATADAMNVLYADCKDAVGKTVILIQKSESPSIEQQGNCYIVNVGECENTKAIEKFILAVVAQANQQEL
jgi:hypothetical protein